jgi:hypothetical protein
MKNRVRQSRTLGSVRGEDGAAMVPLHGHAAGNGGYGQEEPTAATGPLLLGVKHRAARGASAEWMSHGRAHQLGRERRIAPDARACAVQMGDHRGGDRKQVPAFADVPSSLQ